MTFAVVANLSSYNESKNFKFDTFHLLSSWFVSATDDEIKNNDVNCWRLLFWKICKFVCIAWLNKCKTRKVLFNVCWFFCKIFHCSRDISVYDELLLFDIISILTKSFVVKESDELIANNNRKDLTLNEMLSFRNLNNFEAKNWWNCDWSSFIKNRTFLDILSSNDICYKHGNS